MISTILILVYLSGIVAVTGIFITEWGTLSESYEVTGVCSLPNKLARTLAYIVLWPLVALALLIVYFLTHNMK